METSFTALCKAQYDLESSLLKLKENARKEGKRRTKDYVTRKIADVQEQWANFQRNDLSIRNHEHVDYTTNYFNENLYTTTEDLYRGIMETLKRYSSELEAETNTNTSKDKKLLQKIKLRNSLVEQLDQQLENITREAHQTLTKGYYQTKQRTVIELWESITKMNNDIIINSDEDIDPSNQYLEEKYDKTLVHLQDMINGFDEHTTRDIGTSNSQVRNHSANQDIKLPRISIPQFTGDFLNWNSFQDLFTQIIHNNDSLTNAQRMFYLKTSTKEEAAHLIRHLSITNENYATAWELMTNRYNNQRILLDAQLEKLTSQNTIQETSDQIKILHDTTRECLFSIKNMGIDVTSWDSMVLHIIKKKLDKHTLRLYEDSIKNPREIQTLTSFLEFLESRFIALMHNKQKPEITNISKSSNNSRFSYKTFNSNQISNLSSNACPKCAGAHKVFMCEAFKVLTPEKRLEFIRNKKFCTNCLHKHEGKKCSSTNSCKQCGKRHNTLLHLGSATSASSLNVNKTNETILLATALIGVRTTSGNSEVLRALIDSGSQASFITTEAAKMFKSSKITASVTGLGLKATEVHNMVDVTMVSLNRQQYTLTLKALVLNKITNVMPQKKIHDSVIKSADLKCLDLADEHFYKPSKIDILLGADIYSNIILEGVVKINNGSLTAQRTKLGWILFGSTSASAYSSRIVSNIADVSTLEHQLQKFWELEEVNPHQSGLNFDDEQCEENYVQTTTRDHSGRYTVRLPINKHLMEFRRLGESKNQAMARFLQLERKFKRHPQLHTEYNKFMDEYLQMGHMSDINGSSSFEYFLPHHAVIKEDSTTTKLRVVFDGSAVTSSGESLNNILHTGQTLQKDLKTILLQWRKHKIAFTADIEKMYRQINIHPDDRHLQKILWRPSSTEPVREYTLNTVTYGISSAPYLALRTLQQLASDDQHLYPAAAHVLSNHFYVDDVLSGADNFKDASHITKQLMQLLDGGGFSLRKWATNSADLLKTIPCQRRSQKSIEFNKTETIKTLGIYWNPATDHFHFKFSPTMENNTRHPTKRILLSETASIFDPLGWISPCVIKAKILVQDCWLANLSWDHPLPSTIAKSWITLRSTLTSIQSVKIPRWINVDLSSSSTYEIHAFCDSSERAYAAVIYLRIVNHNKVSVILLTAKTKVSPVKKRLSLPKLELEAAHLLSSLVKRTIQDIGINIDQIYAWSDSMIVLAWLKGHPSKWRTFVANRVSLVHSNLENAKWNHVVSEENPADCATRGINGDQLLSHKLWWSGPAWLSEETLKLSSVTPDTDLELRPSMVSLPTRIVPECILTSKYSSLIKTMRITAYCLRFCSNARQRKRSLRNTSALTADEIHHSSVIIIQLVQQSSFAPDISALKSNQPKNVSSKLQSLNPILDSEGILRVGGRLTNSDLPFDEQHPIILPRQHHITDIIIQHAHKGLAHAGAQATLAALRTQYWIINGKNAVKGILFKCVVCHRIKATTAKQLMGSLPAPRVTISHPFTNVGTDYAGPIQLRPSKGRGIKSYKGYIALFICFATRAIHLEIVSDLSSQGFIAAFKRFIGRRGLPKNIYSDNGTNFVGANKLLEQNQNLAIREFQESLANDKIQWHFNPPSAPHFGGLWEAGVKSTKYHLRRILAAHTLTYEELNTAIINIESCLNSRPLCPLTNDVNDLQVITPGHFLIGRSLKSFPTRDFTTKNINTLTRWEIVTRIQQEFWNTWRSEYLNRLQQRPKWKMPENNLEIGHIVILKEENTHPYRWPLARVIEVHPGKDNLVRVATVKTETSTFKRPVCKLSPLPISYNDKDEYNTLISTNKYSPPSKLRKKRISASQSYVQTMLQSSTWDEVQRKRKKAAINSPKSQIFSTHLLLITILGIIWHTSANAIQETINFDIKPINVTSGLYFEELGRVNMEINEWNLIIVYNLSNYFHEIQEINLRINKLAHSCFDTGDVSNTSETYCAAIINQLYLQHDAIQKNNELLYKGQESKRVITKRSPLDIVGRAANILFGVLDDNYAKNIEEKFANLIERQQFLTDALKNHTSILEATTNIITKSQADIMSQFENFDQQISGLEIHTQKYQTFFTSAIHIMMIMNHYQQTQDTLIDMIMDTQHGKITHMLISIKQLTEQLHLIKNSLPPGLKLPDDNTLDEITQLYKLITSKSRVTETSVIIQLKIPLLNSEDFQIYQMVPVPINQNSQHISISPETDFLIINLDRSLYYPLSKEEIHRCKLSVNNRLICLQQHQFYTQASNNSQCELYLLTHRHELSSHCQFTITTNQPKVWIKLYSPNRWIFIFEHEAIIDIICNNQIYTTKLKGSGILTFKASCVLKQDNLVLTSSQSRSSNMQTSFIPTINIRDQIKEIIISNFTYHTTHTLEELTDLQNTINRQRIAETRQSTLSYHDAHQYTIGYLTIVGLIAISIYIAYQKRTKTRPVPQPRRIPQIFANSMV